MNNSYYNPYMNGCFQPNQFNQQQNQFNQQQNNNSNQTSQYAFVNGVDGAKNYILQPNQSMLLMDQENLLCYRKETDNIGKSSLRYYELKEIDEATALSITKPKITQPNYASKEDIDNINKRLDELFKRLDSKPRQNKVD